MSTTRIIPEDSLVDALATEARGPRRNGIFAVWLFVRVATGVVGPHPLSPRAHQRRLEALKRRLSSLSVPAALRRALIGAIGQAAECTTEDVALALRLLVTPVQETLGPAVAAAVQQAAREAESSTRYSNGS